MIVDKKRVFLYSSILLLILIGVYFVNSIGFVNRNIQLYSGFITTNTSTYTNINDTITGGYNLSFSENTDLTANWTRGGNTELINLTIQMNADAFNIYIINITVPSGYANITNFGITSTTNSTIFNLTGSGANITMNWSLDILGTPTGGTKYAVFRPYSINATSAGYNLSAGQNISMWFNAIAINGSETVYNWTVIVSNESNRDTGFGALLGIDGRPPRLLATNVTDGPNLRTSFSGTQYLRYDTTDINKKNTSVVINLTVTDYNLDRVLLVYNNTGGSINFIALRNLLYNVTFLNQSSLIPSAFMNFTVLEYAGPGGGKANFTTLATRSDVSLASAPTYLFSFNISNNTWGEGAGDGTAFKYVFVVYDLYNQSEILNNSNAEYVIARDVANPTVTLTAPTDTTIDINGPIKYTCSGSDTSSIASCSMVLTKPNSDTVTKTGCSEQTFTTTDTNGAGTNTVQCTVTDGVGRTASTSKTFSVSSATTSSSGGGGGGGSGGGSAGTTAENPVTVKTGESVDAGTLSTTETFTSVAKEGTVTFTVTGTSHSAKVLDITTTSVTIEVSSTPQQLTLNIGDTKEIDLTDDGKNDLSVTLKSITNGVADLVFKSLEVSAPPSGETGGAGVVTGEGAKPSNTWLWVALIVVVLVLVIWYFGRKKQ